MARSDFSFFHSLKTRYAEIDAQGIVFNAHYLTFIDTAVYEYFQAFEFDLPAYTKATGKDFHTLHVELDYAAQTGFDERLDIGVRTSKIGNSSLGFVIEIFGEDEVEPRIRGGLVWVHADPKAKKSVPLPKEIKELISGFEGL